MKNHYKFLLITLLTLAGFYGSLNAQCANDNIFYTDYNAPITVGASVGFEICVYAGEFITVDNMEAGNTYRISTCGSPDIVDTRITVYSASGGAPLGFNDDFCGLRAQIDFTPVANGSFDVLLDATGPNNTCLSDGDAFLCGEIVITLISTSSGAAYCVPAYGNPGGTSNGDFINGVSLGTISNLATGSESGPSYNDYTNLSTNLNAGTQYTLSIQNNPDFTEIVSAWIDYNQDLEFSENERLGQINGFAANTTGQIVFTTPVSVLSGPTRLRVRMVFSVPTTGGLVDPCALSQFGETEDYSVIFGSGPPGPPGGLSFSTICGLTTTIQDNACPNYAQAAVEVTQLTTLGTGYNLVSAEIIIEHPMAADLDIYLESPGGQLVELSTDNGGAGSDYGAYSPANCTETALFTMSAVDPISGASTPFVGSYIPEGDINDFNSGTAPNGFWKLKVCDDFSGDVGTIRFFKLNFEINQTEAPGCVASYNIADGATDVSLALNLNWIQGTGTATSYDVYVGTTSTPGLVSNDQAGLTYDLDLLPSTTYFFQVVPANNAGSAVDCPVFSFTTAAGASNEIPIISGEVTTCSGTFTDGGGLNDNYNNEEFLTFTIYPGQPNSAVQAVFNSFELDASSTDILVIFDGIDETAILVGTFLGSDNPGTVTATNPSGALTFGFFSDEVGNAPGWAATLSCVSLSGLPSCAINQLPADQSDSVPLDANLAWAPGDGITLTYDVYFGTNQVPVLVASGITGTTFDLPVLEENTVYYYQIVPGNSEGAAVDCPINQFSTEVPTTGGDTIIMGNGQQSTCSAVFFDSGGQADYSNGENFTLTVTPTTPNSVLQISFTSFVTEELDTLKIYSGTGTSSDPIAVLSGDLSPGVFTSGAIDGTLTFSFTSDAQISAGGWLANLTCVPAPVAACVISPSPSANAVDVSLTPTLSWEAGDAETVSYDVYFGTTINGLSIVANDIVTTSFAVPALLANTTYFWQVLPSNIFGETTTCNVTSFTTLAEAPACAINYSPADGATDVSVNPVVSWSPAATGGAPATYTVFGGIDPLDLIILSEDQAGTTYEYPTALAGNTTYFWLVIPSNSAGAATDCSVNSFTTAGSTDVLMQDASLSVCQGTFYDDGGADDDYTNLGGEALTLTLTPSTPESAIQVAFSEFFTEEGFDSLVVYNGNSIAAPVLGIFQGDVNPGILVSGASDGSLTFVFTSDVSENEFGWVADISCASTNAAPLCASNLSPADEATDINPFSDLSWSNGGGIVTAYNVYLGTDAGNLLLVSSDAATTFSPTDLLPNTTYFWQVVPANEDALAEGCPIQSFTTGSISVLMQNGSLTVCDVNFYDSGGADGNYQSDEVYTLTLTPSTPGTVLSVVFSDYNTENTYDFLTVYNGNSSAAPLLDIFTGVAALGTGNTPTVVNSSAADGSLTFEFTSDASVNRFGWDAQVFCVDPNAAPNCAGNYVPVDASTGVSASDVGLSWTSGGGISTGYDVYFGTDALTMVLVSENQAGVTYAAGDLELNTTYFWQIVPQGETADAEGCPINTFTTTNIQDILMQNATITTCSANFYDSGGPGGSYQNNENLTLTFVPETPNSLIEVTFNSFAVEQSTFSPFTIFDTLYVYNGPDMNSPLIGFFSGTTIPGPFTSSDASGAITFHFTSDTSVLPAGWSASVTCIDAGTVPGCVTNATPADAAIDVNFAPALTWSAASGVVTGYDVYFGTDADNLVLVSDNQLGTSYDPGTLELSTTYFWQVIPFNEQGPAVDCAVLSFTTAAVADLIIFNGETTLCAGNLFDSGGSDAGYQVNEDFTLTVFPSTPGSFLQADFVSFSIENNFDFLEVIDGSDANGTVLQNLTGTTLPATIVSSSPDGALTFHFTSDFTVTSTGFEIALSCFTSTVAPDCAVNFLPAEGDTSSLNAILSWTSTGLATSFDVYFGSDPDNLVLVADDFVGTSYTPVVVANTTYFWQIVPSNSFGSAEGCLILSFVTSGSSDVNIFNGEITTCNSNFYDSGGPTGQYLNSEDYTMTVFPGAPNSVIRVTFTTLNTENNFDFLSIFNGNTTGAPQLANFTGLQVNLPIIFTSSSADGSLTFNFTSDTSVLREGWVSTLTCVDTTIVPGCVQNASPADGDTTVNALSPIITWAPGDGLVTGYDVYFGETADNLVLVSDNQTGTSFNPGTLELSTGYCYQIVPSNANGVAAGCPVNCFVTSESVDILMSNNTVTTCNATFFDSGGAAANYLLNENSILTINPSIPGNAIQVTFTAFNTENNFDFLTIYAGNSTAAPAIGTFTGLNGPIGPITSTAGDGSLTFEFTSDFVIAASGWSATVSCVNVNEPPACVQITEGPVDNETDVCVNGAVFTWLAGTGAPAQGYDVYFSLDGIDFIQVSDNQTEQTYDAGLLEPNTSYAIIIVPTNSFGDAVGCDTINFTTGTCFQYCEAGSQICDEFISSVVIGNINNVSDCSPGGYADYTNLIADVYIGTESSIIVGNGPPVYTGDQAGIWIDWNRDGDFGDADETIVVSGTPGIGPYTAQILPPAGALLGTTVMRVRITFTGVVDPCGFPVFGEVEDYTINVNAPLACPFPNGISVSDVTVHEAVVTWNPVTDALQYLVRYRTTAEDVSIATWTNPIAVTSPDFFAFLLDLQGCETYVLQVGTACDDTSDVVFSGNVTFTTHCIECTSDLTAESEACGEDLNGGCNATPPVYEPLTCGETVCGTTTLNPSTRDTDWFALNVTADGVYTVELLAEFNGSIFFVDVADCASAFVVSQANFTANQNFTLATSLAPGTYAVVLVPVFGQPDITCDGFNRYTLTLAGGITQIAPVAPVCLSAVPFNLFALPGAGTWSGDGITDAVNGTFDASIAGLGSHIITFESTANGCTSQDTVVIEVIPSPIADFVGLGAEYCTADAPVTLSGIPAGGNFTIEGGVGIVGTTFTPGDVIPGTYDITYIVPSGACSATITQSVLVQGGPAVTFDLVDAVCNQDAVIALSGSLPGGTFSGPGVTGTNFDPSVANIGANTITYQVSIPDSVCPGSATQIIQVNPAPIVTLTGVIGTYCLNSGDVTLIGTPTLGTFSGPGVTGNSFDPATAGLGTHIVRYEFNNGTCIGFDEVTVEVIDNLTVTINGVPPSICSDDTPFALTSTPAGATFAGPGVSGNNFDPRTVGAGTHTVTATLTSGGCTATVSQTLTVNPAPNALWVYSVNNGTVIFTNLSTNATSYSWDFGDSESSTEISPSHAYGSNGVYIVVLTATSAECGSEVFTALVDINVGIGSIEGVDMIQLYPNPTAGQVNLVFNSLNQQSFVVRITDATGRLIQTDDITNYVGKFNRTYDLSDKAKGVYFFTITSQKGAVNFKVVRD